MDWVNTTVDTVLSDSSLENVANISQINWNWVRSMKFKTVRIHFLSDFFGLLSSRNIATLTMWLNDFSFLLTAILVFFENLFYKIYYYLM